VALDIVDDAMTGAVSSLAVGPASAASSEGGETSCPAVSPTSDVPAAGAAVGGGTVRSLWQYRHLIAASWISSAQ